MSPATPGPAAPRPDDATLVADWLPLASTAPAPEAWARLEQWVRGGPARLPAEIAPLLREHRTNATRELALLGLALAGHHAALGEPPPPDVWARVLIGAHRLNPGPLRDACTALLADRDRGALYHEIAAGLPALDPASSAYHHGSLLLALVPFSRIAGAGSARG